MAQTTQQRDDKGAGAPSAAARKQTALDRLKNKKITITLSLPKAVFGAFFLLFVLIWVFIFGVMLGRGHNPEDVVPELAKVMPAPSAPAAAQPDEPIDEVLKPQDLKYHDTLKAKDPAPAVRPAEPPRQAPQQPAPPAAPKPAPQTAAPKPAPAAPPAPAVTRESEDQTVYNYVYQVAAFNNSAAAQAMQKKLQDGGLSVKTAQSESRGTTWYRILVSFKGKPEDTRSLRAKLAPYGISTIILRGKSPSN